MVHVEETIQNNQGNQNQSQMKILYAMKTKNIIYLWFKIQEIFPEGVANQVNKGVCMHEVVYKICKFRGKYFLYF